MTQIHPSAIVDSQAELAEDVVVGPFCLVGPKASARVRSCAAMLWWRAPLRSAHAM